MWENYVEAFVVGVPKNLQGRCEPFRFRGPVGRRCGSFRRAADRDKRKPTEMLASGRFGQHQAVADFTNDWRAHMSRDTTEVAGVKELDRESEGHGQDTQAKLFNDAYDKNPGAGGGDKGAAVPQPEVNERGGVVARDGNGRITRVDYPDGVTYEYGKFDAKGNPASVKITDHKDGDFGQWKRESNGLWRSYNKDKPNYEVVEGEWKVDDQGVMHMDGRQSSRPLPPKDNKGYTEQAGTKIARDGQGRITSTQDTHGVKYEYKGFDASGQPTSVKITQRGHKDYGEWKKERNGLWRAYDNGKPTSQVIVGEWRVNEKGEMSHTGHQDMQPLSRAATEKPAVRGGESRERASKPAEKAPELKSEFFSESGHTLKRFPDGKLAEVTRGNGETTRFNYADGKLSEFTLPGGTLMTTSDGKTWKNSKTGESSELKFEVKDDGTYSIEKAGKKAVLHPDGSTVRSDIVTGSPDRLTSVTYANGDTSSFKYGADGKINEVSLPGGAVYSSTDGKAWTSNQGGQPFQAKVEAQPDGTYSIERDGKKSTMETDGVLTKEDVASGRNVLIFPNGTIRHFDGKDDVQPSKVTTPDGRELKLNQHSAGEYEIKSGDSLSAIARDLLEANNINIAGYKPSHADVVQAIDLLVKANGMANKHATIRAGHKLKIPRELAT